MKAPAEHWKAEGDRLVPRRSSGGASGSWTPDPQTTLDPRVATFDKMQKAKVPFLNPQAGNIGSAIKTYESMITPEARPQPGRVFTPGQQPQAAGDSWRNRVYADRAQNSRPYSSGGGTNQNQAAAAAIPVPRLPEFKAQEYAPPGEDQGVYKAARAEAMGPGIRALREGTREAISSAQSLDNPNARSKFIKQALHGYGQGLERVAAGASREGRQVADRKRNEQLDIYRTNYAAKNDAYLKNYQNQINTLASEFAQSQSAALAGVPGGSPANSRYQQILAKQRTAGISGYAGR